MKAIGPQAYSATVWLRFTAPQRAGHPPEAVSGCAESSAHQLRVCFHRSDSGYRFTAIGCPTTIAAADYCAEQLDAGRTPQAAEMMDGLEIPEDRRHCVLLCEDAMAALAARLAQALSGQDRQAS
ncbi:hypothetical protein [Algiphilus aromaticivorans]|jgi:hypothetical protein|uniref:hypothetical protein n=1 Tax=Algiphilus aromaticivorans TaxID=382454 RepID=UPI0005C1529E|nr:hypothetical protein [Algiphilus aromaticivorans]